jgi:hypothetical protein
MHRNTPVRYLVLIESGGAMVARLYDAKRGHVSDIDASSEEVAVMTAGLQPRHAAEDAVWSEALRGHNAAERRAAQVYTLDV